MDADNKNTEIFIELYEDTNQKLYQIMNNPQKYKLYLEKMAENKEAFDALQRMLKIFKEIKDTVEL